MHWAFSNALGVFEELGYETLEVSGLETLDEQLSRSCLVRDPCNESEWTLQAALTCELDVWGDPVLSVTLGVATEQQQRLNLLISQAMANLSQPASSASDIADWMARSVLELPPGQALTDDDLQILVRRAVERELQP